MPIATGIDVAQPELQSLTIHIFHFDYLCILPSEETLIHFSRIENDYILFYIILYGNISMSIILYSLATFIKNKVIN